MSTTFEEEVSSCFPQIIVVWNYCLRLMLTEQSMQKTPSDKEVAELAACPVALQRRSRNQVGPHLLPESESQMRFPGFQVCSGHIALEALNKSVVPFLLRVEVSRDNL